MKKILFTVNDISTQGGTERVIINVANMLCQFYDVSVLSFYKSLPNPQYKVDNRVSIVWHYNVSEDLFKHRMSNNIFSRFYYKNIYKILLSTRIYRLYKKSPPDVIISSCSMYFPYLKYPCTRYYRWIHLNFTKYHHRNNLYDALILVSGAELDIWKRFCKRIYVIPHFIPLVPSKCTSLDSKVVISIGRMVHQKGFLRLLDIWKIIQDTNKFKDWKLSIVGDGCMKDDIISKVKLLGMESSVSIKPFTRDVDNEYINADIYAMTSHFEGFGMVLIEAMSFGLPCIAFDVPTGPRDIIEDSKTGYLVENNNIESFANRLISLMENKNLLNKFGDCSRKSVSRKFSKDASLVLWKSIIDT